MLWSIGDGRESEVVVIECCGAKRETPFCPMCGKRLPQAPLIELLAYCQKRVEVAKKCMQTAGNHPRQETYRKKQENQIATWQQRVVALTELLSSHAAWREKPVESPSQEVPARVTVLAALAAERAAHNLDQPARQ